MIGSLALFRASRTSAGRTNRAGGDSHDLGRPALAAPAGSAAGGAEQHGRRRLGLARGSLDVATAAFGVIWHWSQGCFLRDWKNMSFARESGVGRALIWGGRSRTFFDPIHSLLSGHLPKW